MLISNFSWNFENSKSTMSRINSRITFQHNFFLCAIFYFKKSELIESTKLFLWIPKFWSNSLGIRFWIFCSILEIAWAAPLCRISYARSRNSTWQWGMKFFTERPLMTSKWPRNDLWMTTIWPQNDHERMKGAQGTHFLVDSTSNHTQKVNEDQFDRFSARHQVKSESCTLKIKENHLNRLRNRPIVPFLTDEMFRFHR